MKTTNQFDYPTAAATTYKAYRQEVPKNEQKQGQYYKQVIKQEGEQERTRVKQEQQRRKEKQNQEEQNKLRQQIERKKKELNELQRKRQQAVKQALVASEQAKIKQEQDRIKKIQNEQRTKQNDQNAQFRFKDALRRLECQRQQNAIQQRQAQQRRKAQQEAQKVERKQAIKFKQYLLTKQEQEHLEAEEEQQRQLDLMRNGLGRIGLNKNPVNYSKTFMHNPHFTFKEEQQGPNAFERGQSEEKRKQQISQYKKQQEEYSRKRSLERGQKALQKISRQNEYNNYVRETSQQQVQYNLQRIQEGKKNQFIGIKPLTLTQMQENKKIRGQQQFQELFLAPQVDIYQAPASKYMIIQKKYNNDSQCHRDFSSIDYKAESNEKTDNARKYFWQNKEQQQEQIQPRPILVEATAMGTKPMAETRLDEPIHKKQQLSYSQSQDDSSYA